MKLNFNKNIKHRIAPNYKAWGIKGTLKTQEIKIKYDKILRKIINNVVSSRGNFILHTGYFHSHTVNHTWLVFKFKRRFYRRAIKNILRIGLNHNGVPNRAVGGHGKFQNNVTLNA